MRYLFLLFCISTSIFASNIGVIDTEYILTKYNRRVAVEKNLEQKRQTLNKEIENLRQELLRRERVIKSKKVLSKSDLDELDVLKTQFRQKIENCEKIYDDAEQNAMYELKFEIDSAAILVGKEKNLDMVIDKTATVFGGVDLTNDVIKFLNSKQTQKFSTDSLLKNK